MSCSDSDRRNQLYPVQKPPLQAWTSVIGNGCSSAIGSSHPRVLWARADNFLQRNKLDAHTNPTVTQKANISVITGLSNNRYLYHLNWVRRVSCIIQKKIKFEQLFRCIWSLQCTLYNYEVQTQYQSNNNTLMSYAGDNTRHLRHMEYVTVIDIQSGGRQRNYFQTPYYPYILYQVL